MSVPDSPPDILSDDQVEWIIENLARFLPGLSSLATQRELRKGLDGLRQSHASLRSRLATVERERDSLQRVADATQKGLDMAGIHFEGLDVIVKPLNTRYRMASDD